MKKKPSYKFQNQQGAVFAEATFALLILLLSLQVMVQYALAVRDRNEIQKALVPAIRILSSERDLCLATTNVDTSCFTDSSNPYCCANLGKEQFCFGGNNRISSYTLITTAEDWVDFVLNKGNSAGQEHQDYYLAIYLTLEDQDPPNLSTLAFTIAIKDFRGDNHLGDFLGLRKAASFASAVVPINSSFVSCLSAEEFSNLPTSAAVIEDAKSKSYENN